MTVKFDPKRQKILSGAAQAVACDGRRADMVLDAKGTVYIGTECPSVKLTVECSDDLSGDGLGRIRNSSGDVYFNANG